MDDFTEVTFTLPEYPGVEFWAAGRATMTAAACGGDRHYPGHGPEFDDADLELLCYDIEGHPERHEGYGECPCWNDGRFTKEQERAIEREAKNNIIETLEDQ